ncbi:MAG: DUF503 domain-containing protein [Pseudomonadota bacterium]
MHLAVLTVTFSLPGCTSRKEKRQRMGGLHERYGRNPAVAVCESGAHDQPETAEWTFVVTGMAHRDVESLSSEIEDRLQRTVDGRVTDVSREFL